MKVETLLTHKAFIPFKEAITEEAKNRTYWHSLARVKERDSIKESVLLKNNYQIPRITEKEYDENPLQTVNKCIAYLLGD